MSLESQPYTAKMRVSGNNTQLLYCLILCYVSYSIAVYFRGAHI